MTSLIPLERLNRLPLPDFTAAVGDIFEHAPWVAEAAAAGRPYSTVAVLHAAMHAAVTAAPVERQLAFIRAHPELGSKVRRADITIDSQTEQGSLGLDRLSDEEFFRFSQLNAAYRERFGFPFIICVRRHTRDSILNEFARRLDNDVGTERNTALHEIGLITRLRLVSKIDGPGKPKTDGRLSTHVLDLATGKPAQGVAVALYEMGGSARGLIAQTVTNADGRTDTPLLFGAPLRIGTYELHFDVSAYFSAILRDARLRRAPQDEASDSFLTIVPIRFSITEPEGHYHVPLLATPWSYTTCRGS